MQNQLQNSIFSCKLKLTPTKLKAYHPIYTKTSTQFEEVKKIIEKKLNPEIQNAPLICTAKPKIKSVPMPRNKPSSNLRSKNSHFFPKFSKEQEKVIPFIFKSLKMRSLTPTLRIIQSRSRNKRPLGKNCLHVVRINSPFESKIENFGMERNETLEIDSNLSSSSENFNEARYA